MFYASAEHQQRFMESMQHLGKLGERAPDAEYASALYLLTATAALWNKASGYVDAERIEFPALLAEQDFSGGYGVLVTRPGISSMAGCTSNRWSSFGSTRKIFTLRSPHSRSGVIPQSFSKEQHP